MEYRDRKDIVETDKAEVGGNAQSHLLSRSHDRKCPTVIVADDRGCALPEDGLLNEIRCRFKRHRMAANELNLAILLGSQERVVAIEHAVMGGDGDSSVGIGETQVPQLQQMR